MNQNDNQGLEALQYYSKVKEEERDCENITSICQTNLRDKEKNPSKEEPRPRTANKAPGHKEGKPKLSPPVAAISVDSGGPPQRRTACKKQSRRTERTSGGDNLNNHDTADELELNQVLLDNSISEQPKTRPCNSRVEHRKDPHCVTACEKRRTRGSGKTAPKSKEFIETESSSSTSSDSESHSEQEEYSLHQLQTGVSTSAGSDQKLKDAGNSHTNKTSNSCAGTFGSVNTRTSNDIAQELEEQFYTLVPFGRNELLSPLKDADEVKVLWVKIDLTLLSRIPQHLPEEPLVTTTGLKQAVSMQSNIVPDQPSEKILPKSRRKRKV